MSLSRKLRAAQSMYGPYLQTGWAGRGGPNVRQFDAFASRSDEQAIPSPVYNLSAGSRVMVFCKDSGGSTHPITANNGLVLASPDGEIYTGIVPAAGLYTFTINPVALVLYCFCFLELVATTTNRGDIVGTIGGTTTDTATITPPVQVLGFAFYTDFISGVNNLYTPSGGLALLKQVHYVDRFAENADGLIVVGYGQANVPLTSIITCTSSSATRRSMRMQAWS